MAKIRGVIVGETDKALRLKVTEDELSQLMGETRWFPKTQIRLDEREVGIVIPDWLYESNANVQE